MLFFWAQEFIERGIVPVTPTLRHCHAHHFTGGRDGGHGNVPLRAFFQTICEVFVHPPQCKVSSIVLVDERGRPYFDLNYYAVAKDGRYAGASLYEGRKFAVADARGARLEDCAFLYRRAERPTRR